MLRRTLIVVYCLAMAGCTSLADRVEPCELFGEACELEIDSCYMFTVDIAEENLAAGDARCLRAGSLTQGTECSLMNQCSDGHGCILGRTSTDDTLVCARYCDFDGSLTGVGCPEGFECRQINSTYSNTTEVADAFGFCTPLDWDQDE